MTTTPEPEGDEDAGYASHLDENGNPKIIERHLIVPPQAQRSDLL